MYLLVSQGVDGIENLILSAGDILCGENIAGLDLMHQIDRIKHENGSSMVSMAPAYATESLMSYVIGGDGMIESFVKKSPTEYSFYILNNGIQSLPSV